LWAGIKLGASATEVGLLLAAETTVSFVVRPIAGVLADRRIMGNTACSGDTEVVPCGAWRPAGTGMPRGGMPAPCVSGIVLGSGPLFMPGPVAASIGWPTSRFQWEVGGANIGYGVAAVMAPSLLITLYLATG
jgi:hypothetical protein